MELRGHARGPLLQRGGRPFRASSPGRHPAEAEDIAHSSPGRPGVFSRRRIKIGRSDSKNYLPKIFSAFHAALRLGGFF